jgi:hypothetical protein
MALPGVHEPFGLEKADRLAHGHRREAMLRCKPPMRWESVAGFQIAIEDGRPEIVGYLLIGRSPVSRVDRHDDQA